LTFFNRVTALDSSACPPPSFVRPCRFDPLSKGMLPRPTALEFFPRPPSPARLRRRVAESCVLPLPFPRHRLLPAVAVNEESPELIRHPLLLLPPIFIYFLSCFFAIIGGLFSSLGFLLVSSGKHPLLGFFSRRPCGDAVYGVPPSFLPETPPHFSRCFLFYGQSFSLSATFSAPFFSFWFEQAFLFFFSVWQEANCRGL